LERRRLGEAWLRILFTESALRAQRREERKKQRATRAYQDYENEKRRNLEKEEKRREAIRDQKSKEANKQIIKQEEQDVPAEENTEVSEVESETPNASKGNGSLVSRMVNVVKPTKNSNSNSELEIEEAEVEIIVSESEPVPMPEPVETVEPTPEPAPVPTAQQPVVGPTAQPASKIPAPSIPEGVPFAKLKQMRMGVLNTLEEHLIMANNSGDPDRIKRTTAALHDIKSMEIEELFKKGYLHSIITSPTSQGLDLVGIITTEENLDMICKECQELIVKGCVAILKDHLQVAEGNNNTGGIKSLNAGINDLTTHTTEAIYARGQMAQRAEAKVAAEATVANIEASTEVQAQ